MMMQQAGNESNAGIQEQVNGLIGMVESGVRSGEAAHTMERSLFQQMLKLGQSVYFDRIPAGFLFASRGQGRFLLNV